ncbi:MAG: hypothetical protein Q4E69_04950 [Bacilli bacterium]|nr:hypothetical protein [Bacilli bacterium]
MTRREQIERLKKRRALLLMFAEENKKVVKTKSNEKVYMKTLGRHPLANS